VNQELVRIVDNIARDKNIDREAIFIDLEEAMISAARKHFGDPESEIIVNIDRNTGEVTAFKNNEQIDMRQLGRIPAQTAKQVMIQKIKADERDSIYAEYIRRKGEIVNGSVVRYESGFIRRLFELEVPEINESIIEIRGLAREAGYRTKVAVVSFDSKVDPVGACVGVRGSRIKNIVDELGGEKIDIVRWNESSQVLITNALMPAKVSEIALCFELGRATVVVDEDQLSLAIGKHGQNVRLAARLTGWDIDILTPDEYNQGIERLTACVKNVPEADDTIIDKLIALGVISVMDLDDVGAEPLISEISIDPDLAAKLTKAAAEDAKRLAAEAKQIQAQNLLEKETTSAEENDK